MPSTFRIKDSLPHPVDGALQFGRRFAALLVQIVPCCTSHEEQILLDDPANEGIGIE
jgi:hypothetical protein